MEAFTGFYTLQGIYAPLGIFGLRSKPGALA
jgi:hypothetical protein